MTGFDDLSNMIKMASLANIDENIPLDQQFRQIVNKSNNNKEKIPAIVWSIILFESIINHNDFS